VGLPLARLLFPAWFLERIEPSVDRFLGRKPAATDTVSAAPAAATKADAGRRAKKRMRKKVKRVRGPQDARAGDLLRNLPKIDLGRAVRARDARRE